MPTGVSNDGSSTFSNKVAPLPPEDLLFTNDSSSLTIVGIEDNDDAQGPGEIHPNGSVMRLSINVQTVYQCLSIRSLSICISMPINASGLRLSLESRRYWENATLFVDVESRRRALRRSDDESRGDSIHTGATSQKSWRKRSSGSSASLSATFANDLFASHCWRSPAEAQQAKRRIIAELSRPMVSALKCHARIRAPMAASSGHVASVGELRVMAVSGCQIDAMYVCGLVDGNRCSRLVDSKSNSGMVIAWYDRKI